MGMIFNLATYDSLHFRSSSLFRLHSLSSAKFELNFVLDSNT